MMASQTRGARGVHVSVAARTDIGRKRDNNEDSLLVTDLSSGVRPVVVQGIQRLGVGPRGVLLAVSDGVGGANAGEVASAMVVRSLARALEAAPTTAPPAIALKLAVREAHLDVAAAAHGHERKGMGATLTAVYVSGRTAYVAEVGDSRAYLLRGGTIRQLTRDQSIAQLLVDAGTLRPEALAGSPMKNTLAQAMGHGDGVEVAIGRLELRDRDCLLLCSDGLTATLSDDEIRRAVLAAADLDAACAQLVALANERGGPDNVTVILAGVGGDLVPVRDGERVSATYEELETFGPHRRPERASRRPATRSAK